MSMEKSDYVISGDQCETIAMTWDLYRSRISSMAVYRRSLWSSLITVSKVAYQRSSLKYCSIRIESCIKISNIVVKIYATLQMKVHVKISENNEHCKCILLLQIHNSLWQSAVKSYYLIAVMKFQKKAKLYV